jgi:cytochrome c oxidase subunit 3
MATQTGPAPTPVRLPVGPPGAGQQKGMSQGMLMMLFFLGSEAMLFASLFAAYFFVRFNIADEWPPLDQSGEPYELPLVLTGINTAILVFSSFTLHWGEHRLKMGDRKGLERGLIVTMLLGLTFLIIQLNEYWHLGFTPGDTAFGSSFYALTGFHGAHVTLGLTILFIMYIRVRKARDFSPQWNTPLAAGSLYWHFVDVVWVILYGLVYLL